MISAKPTENLAGITIEGDHDDFYEIMESIYRMTGLEESYDDYYWSVKNRLLGVCYDIRHAFMGDRDIKLVDNGVHDEMMKWHSMIMPRQEVHEKEQEANYFAACLLMPADDVGRFIDLGIQDFEEKGLSAMDIVRIMSEFNVSFDMALNRLESLGIIDLNQKLRLDNERTMKKVGNLLRSVGGNAKLNEPSNVIDIPYEYIDYVIYNYNHNAVPKETLEKVLACYQLSIEDISDKLVSPIDDDDDDLDDLIGGLED